MCVEHTIRSVSILLDEEDLARVQSKTWSLQGQSFVCNGITLPRFICAITDKNLIVNFKNDNKFDFRRENLEWITRKQQWQNSSKRAQETIASKQRIVFYSKCINCQQEIIGVNKFCSNECRNINHNKQKVAQQWIIKDNTAELDLGRNRTAIIDIDQLEKIQSLGLHWIWNGYVVATDKNKRWRTLHQLIANALPGYTITFRDKTRKQDCRIQNLKIFRGKHANHISTGP